MILIRIRRYGSDDWTILHTSGTLEDLAAEVAAKALDQDLEAPLHVQVAREGEAFVDLDEFEWEG